MNGEDNLIVEARSALLDALQALDAHLSSLVLIGAQAVYLHTEKIDVALAEATKDSDLAIDPRSLTDDPRIESAMRSAHFYQNLQNLQPGSWITQSGIPVDLMVAETLAGHKGTRSAKILPHDNTCLSRDTVCVGT